MNTIKKVWLTDHGAVSARRLLVTLEGKLSSSIDELKWVMEREDE